MNLITTPSKRWHALDLLRAVMMLLGIVLHASESYTLSPNDIWPRDPAAKSVFLNYLNSLIHVFRMPVFFVMAGFFGSMLFYGRGPGAMLSNRIKRIVFPFVVFLLILHPVILLTTRFTAGAFSVTLTELSTEITFLPQITYHLWFLYYLILVTAFTFIVALIIRKAAIPKQNITAIFEWLVLRKWAGILIPGIILFLVMVYRWDYTVPTPLYFVPDFGAFLFLVQFYLFGWMLYRSNELIGTFMQYDRLFVLVSIALFTAGFFWRQWFGDIMVGVIRASIIWMFVFGFTGLFIRYGSKASASARYISDSSYWVFLIHLPFTILFPGLMAGWALPAILKFLLSLSATTVICYLSYHYAVRPTFIGKFLNGRKYPLVGGGHAALPSSS